MNASDLLIIGLAKRHASLLAVVAELEFNSVIPAAGHDRRGKSKVLS